MLQPIKIMMADDHVMFRDAILDDLSEDPKISAIGGADNGKELIVLMQKDEPDVVILDIEMPVMSGVAALRIIKKDFPAVKIILLSTHFNDFIDSLMNEGANAYLPKSCKIEILIEAIHAVKNGNYYYEDKSRKLKGTAFGFTIQEMVVIQEIIQGKSNKEIGTKLGISHNTVDFHRKNIYSKAVVGNSTELALFVFKNGIINPKGFSWGFED